MSLQQDNARVDGAVKDLEWGDDVATDPSSESHSRATTTTTARVTTTITSQTPNRAASTSPAPIVIYPKEKKEEDPIRAIQKYLPHLVVDRKIDGIDVDEYEASAANDSSSDGVKVLPVPASLANDHLVDKVSSSVSSSMFDPQPLSKSPSFIAFRASVQRHRCQVGREAWTYYDLGPKDPSVQPLILLPGTSGTAEGFFFQLMELGNKGYRVIAASPPAYYTHDEWCNGFNGFLQAMGLVAKTTAHATTAVPASPSNSSTPPSANISPQPTAAADTAADADAAAPTSPSSPPSHTVSPLARVHVFATSLSAYLMLYYLSHIIPSRNYVSTLILCNGFADTAHFREVNGSSNWCLQLLKRAPSFVVKKFVLDSMPERTEFPEAVDFMVEQMEDNLPTDILRSRLILNILKTRGIVKPESWRQGMNSADPSSTIPFDESRITILDTTDESVMPEEMRARFYRLLPDARYALLKMGGDMPFLAVPDEVNMHLQVHLRHHGVLPGKSTTATNEALSSSSPPSHPVKSSHPTSIPVASASSKVAPSPSTSYSSSPSVPTGMMFLQPTVRPVSTALGYGHDDEDDDNDSIFLSKSGQRKTSKATDGDSNKKEAHADRSSASTLSPAIANKATVLSSSSTSSSPSSITSPPLSTRSRLVLEEEVAKEAARKDAHQAAVLSTLLDDAAIEEEQSLIRRKEIVQQKAEDLF